LVLWNLKKKKTSKNKTYRPFSIRRGGYTGASGPHLVPKFILLIVAEFIFSNLTYEKIKGCLYPLCDDVKHKLRKTGIKLEINNGYWQLLIFGNKISLNFLSKFITSQQWPEQRTEYLHYCNNKLCICTNHIEEKPNELNKLMENCYYEISTNKEITKKCFCKEAKCTPVISKFLERRIRKA